MRPTPQELADSMRDLLRMAGTEVTDDSARARLRRVMSVLKTTRWDEAAFDLLAENALFAESLQALGREEMTFPTPRSFAEANAQNLALRTRLAASLEATRGDSSPHVAALRHDLATKLLARP